MLFPEGVHDLPFGIGQFHCRTSFTTVVENLLHL
jgi:hypothetical protein